MRINPIYGTHNFLHNQRTGDYLARRNEYMEAADVLLEPLAALGITELELVIPHGQPYTAPTDDVFRVIAWSHPTAAERPTIIYGTTMWGISAGSNMVFRANVFKIDGIPGYTIPGYTIPITTPEGDTVAALLPDNNALYILYDAVHYGSTEELAIWRRLMNVAAEKLNGATAPEYAESRRAEMERLKNEAAERAKAESRRQFVGLIANQSNRIINDWKNKRDTCQRYVDEYKTELTKYVRQLDDVNRRIALEEKNNTDYTDKANMEYDAIANLHGVERYECSGDLLTVYTHKILCYDESGNAYQLGRFRIEIKLGTSDVRFFGLDDEYLRRGYWTDHDPHPHVGGDNGRPCIGNLAETIAILTGQYEISALVSVLINWLESVNTSDTAGANVGCWDKVNPETGEVIEEGYSNSGFVCARCGYEMDNEDDTYSCADCGDVLCSECATWIEGSEHYVCNSCREENYTVCECCDDYYRTSAMSRTHDDMVCNNCRASSYTFCPHCDMYHHDDDDNIYLEKYGYSVCNDCLERYYTTCVGCGLSIKNDDGVHHIAHNDKHLCEDCLEKDNDYALCTGCGQWCHVDDLDEAGYCEDCADMEEPALTPAAALDRYEPITPEVTATYEPRTISCQFCGQVLLPEQLMTCERCGEQGCEACINMNSSGVYSCPEHN